MLTTFTLIFSNYYTAVIGFGGHGTLAHHVQIPLWKFMEKVAINGMAPWEAASEAFGRDLEFLQFNSLAIAFRQDGGKFLYLYLYIYFWIPYANSPF
jgi:hypothetical protein